MWPRDDLESVLRTILELDNLHYRYPGQGFLALKGASLVVPEGRKLAVMGRNGCGKSTLFLHCNGILKPNPGTVRLDGRELRYDRGSLLELRRQVGIVFQSAEDQLFSASVAQDISFGPLNLGLSEQEARSRVQAAAETCEILDIMDRPVHALSAGQKTMVALAGVLAMDPRVLIVDEVLGNLDPWARSQVLTVLGRLVDRGKTVLMSTHDLAVAFNWADIVVVMKDGRVVAADSPENVSRDADMMNLVGPPDPWLSRASRENESRGMLGSRLSFGSAAKGG